MATSSHDGAPRALLPAVFTLAMLAAPIAAPAARAEVRVLPVPGIMTPDIPMRAKDFTFIKEGENFHLFWMRHDFTAPWDSTERDLGHAVSRDLIHWTQLDPVLPVRPDKWDNMHIWAPSIVKRGSTFYMYYTGVTRVPYEWNMYQRIGLATSTDLVHWTRADEPVLSGAMIPWALSDSSRFEGSQFRDPFAMPDPTTPGRTLLYYVTTPAADPTQLIVGVAQTTNMRALSDRMPLWSTGAAQGWGWCESPHLVQHNGLWYLFSTVNKPRPVRFRTAASALADSTGWSEEHEIFNMANRDLISTTWFASEILSVPGHDYFAAVCGVGYWIEFYEIVWDATPPGFSLATPVVPDDRRVASLRADLGLKAVRESTTGILFRASLPAASDGRVELFDVGGRLVRTLRSGPMPGGETLVAWDGRLAAGNEAPAGIYFAALTVPAGRCVTRVCLTR